MDETAIRQYLTETFEDVQTDVAYGYAFYFCGPDRKMPFATLATEDNHWDRVSNLSREGVYRLNIGVGKETYGALFGEPPPRPNSEAAEKGYDYTALDRIMPHPEYAPQSWVCVLNPGEATWPTVQRLLVEAHEIARKRRDRREGLE